MDYKILSELEIPKCDNGILENVKKYKPKAKICITKRKIIIKRKHYTVYDVYDLSGECYYRVFCQKDYFKTYNIKQKKWVDSTIDKLLNRVIYIEKERQEIYPDTTLIELHNYQMNIREQELKKKHNDLKKKTDMLMAQLSDLPRDFNNWINNVALTDYKYIFYKRIKNNLLNCQCSNCNAKYQTNINTKGHLRDLKTKCIKCNKKAFFKPQNAEMIHRDRICASILQKTIEGFCLRLFEIKRDTYNPYKNLLIQKISKTYTEEKQRFFFNRYGKFISEYSYETKHNQYNHIREGWFKTNYGILGRCFLYSKNANRVLKQTAFKYFPIVDLTKSVGAVNLISAFSSFLKYPCIEYLIKLKLYNLATEVANINNGYYSHLNQKALKLYGQNMKDVLGVDKQHIKTLQHINPTSDELVLIQKLIKLKQKIQPKDIYFLRNEMRRNLYNVVLDIIETINLSKTIKYLKKYTSKEKKFSDILIEYKDYINNAKKLNWDFKNDMVLYPKNFIKAHDLASDMALEMQNGDKNNKLETLLPKLQKYKFNDAKYTIKIPEKVQELIKEGQTLKHCVGNYSDNYVEGKTVILFIRKNEETEQPFYTIEVKNYQIYQCRTLGNKSYTLNPEVKAFVSKYEKHLTKLKKEENKNKAQIKVSA